MQRYSRMALEGSPVPLAAFSFARNQEEFFYQLRGDVVKCGQIHPERG